MARFPVGGPMPQLRTRGSQNWESVYPGKCSTCFRLPCNRSKIYFWTLFVGRDFVQPAGRLQQLPRPRAVRRTH